MQYQVFVIQAYIEFFISLDSIFGENRVDKRGLVSDVGFMGGMSYEIQGRSVLW